MEGESETDLKKFLQSRIRGWLPKEPNLPRRANATNPRKKPSRVLFAHSPLGLKLVVGLLWLFGIGAVLTLIQQTTQLSYLPADVKLLMAAVTAIDGVGLFVVGAGLLTANKRWIDVAIVFLIASIVAFYVVPLRAALPLEVVALAYLVALRQNRSPKAIQAAPAALVAVLCVAAFLPISANAQIINPSKTPIQTFNQASNNDGFVVTTNVYRYADLDPQKDYYSIEIVVRCPQKNFNHITVNASTDAPEETMATGWLPHASLASPVAVGLGIATLYVGNPDRVQVDYNSKVNVNWAESTLNPKKAETFSTDLWLPQDAHFAVNITVEAGFADPVFGDLWMERLAFGGVEV
jgi:hypothetical protein